MERLTYESDNGYIYFVIDGEKVTIDDVDILKVAQKLKEYEDLEEQGLLLRLPCNVGDSIYSVIEDGLAIVELKFSLDFYARRKNDFGKTVFLTQEEAEQKLKEMRGIEDGTME